MSDKCLWQVLVPTVHRISGKPIRVRFHKVWDKKVREISGGLTILKPAKGEWISPDGKLYNDRMIPVNFIGTVDEMKTVAKITGLHYDELAVLVYKISDSVYIFDNEKATVKDE